MNRLFFIFFAWVLSFHLLFGASEELPSITVQDYCCFLNEVASSDFFHFYDLPTESVQKLDDGSEGIETRATCILRLGNLGSYHYVAIKGKEDALMTGISCFNAAGYYDWKKDTSSTFHFKLCKESFDQELKSNTIHFSFVDDAISSNGISTDKEHQLSVAKGMMFPFLFLTGMVGGASKKPEEKLLGNDCSKSAPENGTVAQDKSNDSLKGTVVIKGHSLTVENFRAATLAYPTAVRFIIREKEGNTFIESQEIDDSEKKNKKQEVQENERVVQAISQALYESGQSVAFVKTLLPQVLPRTIFFSFPNVTAEKLLELLNKADRAAAEESALKARAKMTQAKTSSEMESCFLGIVSRPNILLMDVYEEADELWDQVQKAWGNRPATRRNAEERERALNSARDLLQQAEEALAEKNLDETKLGQLVQNANDVSKFFGWLNTSLSVSGVADAVSVVADRLNQKFERASVTAATKALKAAIKKEEEAKIKAEAAELAIHPLQIQAEEAERRARENDAKHTMKIAQDLMPPVADSDASCWNEWAQNMARIAKITESDWLHRFKTMGQQNAAWILQAIGSAWKERIATSSQVMKDFENGEALEIKKLKALEEAFAKIYEAVAEASIKKKSAEELLLTAEKDELEAKAKKERIKKELDDFEDNGQQLEFAPGSTAREQLQLISERRKAIQQEYIEAHTALKNSSEHHKAMKQALEIANKSATHATKNYQKILEKHDEYEKNALREKERAQARAEADEAAWQKVLYLPYKKLMDQLDRGSLLRVAEDTWQKAFNITNRIESSQTDIRSSQMPSWDKSMELESLENSAAIKNQLLDLSPSISNQEAKGINLWLDVKIWKIKKEAFYVEEALASWEKALDAKRKALEKISEDDSLLKHSLNAEIAWAEAEKNALLADKLIDDPEKLLEIQEAAQASWNRAAEAKEKVLQLTPTADQKGRVRLRVEILLADAKKETFSAASIKERAWVLMAPQIKNLNNLEEREFFEWSWKEVMKAIDRTKLAWGDVVQAYQDGIAILGEDKKEDWDNGLQEALYQKALVTAEPFWHEAHKASRIAQGARLVAQTLKANDPEFESLWQEAMIAAQDAEKTWASTMQEYKALRVIVPEKKKEDWEEILSKAHYNKAIYISAFLWRKAQRIAIITHSLFDKAYELTPGDADFEAAWQEAIVKTTEVEQAWGDVAQFRQQHRETLSINQQIEWDVDLHLAQYLKAYWAVRPLWLEALKTKSVANYFYNKALKLAPDDPHWEVTWESAITKAIESEKAWNHVVQRYQNLRETLPKSQQSDWDANLHIAEYEKASSTFNSSLWPIVKTDKMGAPLVDKVLKLVPADLDFESAFQEVIIKASEMKQKMNHLMELRQQLQEALPESKKADWNSNFDEVQYQKVLYSIRPLFFEARKAMKIADAVYNQALELSSNDADFESASQKVVTKASEAEQALKNLVELRQHLRETLSEDKKGDSDVYLHDAQYQKAFYDSMSLALKAAKAIKIANAVYHKALELASNDSDFEVVWQEVISKASEAEQALNKLIEYRQQLRETLPESKKATWNDNLFYILHHCKAFYVAMPLISQGHKTYAFASAACNEALSLISNDPRFELAWQNVVTKALEAEKPWGKIVEFFKQLKETLPECKGANWDNDLQTAQWQKAFYGIIPSWSNAKRISAVDNTSDAEIKQIVPSASHFKLAWKTLISKASEVERAWSKVIQISQRFREIIPENKKTAWDTHLHDFQYQKASYVIQPLLRRARQAEKIAQAACKDAEDMTFDHSNFDLAWKKASESATEVKNYLEKVISLCQELRETLPESKKNNWDEVLANVLYQRACYAANALVYEVKKIISTAEDLFARAQKHAFDNAGFEEIWQKAITSASEAQRASHSVAQLCQQLSETLPESKKADWSAAISSVRYKDAYWTAMPLHREAQKRVAIAKDAHNKALKLTPHDSDFELAWQEAINQPSEAEEILSKALEFCQQLRSAVPESQQANWDTILQSLQYQKSFWSAMPMWREAQKIQTIVNDICNEARKLTPSDPGFELAWQEAIRRALEVEMKWNSVVQLFQQLRESLSENVKANWDTDFHVAQYQKAIWAAQPLWLAAEKENSIAAAVFKKAVSLTPEDLNFETVWQEAISSSPKVERAWNSVVQFYKQLRETLPESEQADWDADLHTAQYQKTSWAVRPLWREAQKGEAIADFTRNKVFSFIVGESGAELAWQKAIVRASDTEEACENLLQSYQQLRETVPQSKKMNWDASLHIVTLWLQAEKENKNVLVAYHQADLISPENPDFKRAWEEAIKAADLAQEATQRIWENDVKRSAGEDDLNRSYYWKNFYSVLSLSCKALKAEKIANAARAQAKTVTKIKGPSADVAWAKAAEMAQEAQEQWEDVLKEYQRLRETMPENRKSAWEHHLQKAEYQKARCTLSSFLLAIDRGEKIAAICYEKAIKLRPQEDHFEEAWSKAIKANQIVQQAWCDLVKKQREMDAIEGLILPGQKDAWEREKNQTLYQEAYCKSSLCWLEAVKAKKVADAAVEKAHHADALKRTQGPFFERSWRNAFEKVEIATAAWKKAHEAHYCLEETFANLPVDAADFLNANCDESYYWNIFYTLYPRWLDAEKLGTIADAMKNEALALGSSRDHGLEVIWSRVGDITREVTAAWEDLFQAYTAFNEKIPASKKSMWDELLEVAKQQKQTWLLKKASYEDATVQDKSNYNLQKQP